MTKPTKRRNAQEAEGIDTCASCDVDLISHYAFKKIQKMLTIL